MRFVKSVVFLASMVLAQHALAQESSDIEERNWEGAKQISEATQQEFTTRLHQQEMIRHTYVDSDVPDGIVFQSLVKRVSARYGGDEERTLRIVRHSMGFSSDEETLSFVALIDEQQKKLRTTQLQNKLSIMCDLESEKTKQVMFHDVDMLADLKISSSDEAYRAFSRSLDAQTAQSFTAWVEKTKKGFQYTVFKAESALQEKGESPLAFYQIECAKAISALRTER